MRFPLADRLALLSRWFDRTNPRPLLGFFLDSMYPLHRYRGARHRLRDGPVSPLDVVAEDYLEDEERLLFVHDEASGDLVFAASPFFGLPWVEAALGCGVVADFTTGSTRSLPPPSFAGPVSVPAFSEDDPWVRALLSFIPGFERMSAGRCPVGVTLLRGISDLLSALYGGGRFVERMIDEPDEVAETADRLADFWIALGRSLLDRIPLFHGGTGAFFYNTWCPGRTIWLQEDAAALLSPDLYGRLVHPAFCKVAAAFEHSVVHLHPSRFVPVDFLLDDPVSALELHVDVGGPSPRELLPVHRRILEKKPLLVWDYRLRARRPAERDDVRVMVTVTDALAEFDLANSVINPADMPATETNARGFVDCHRWSLKPSELMVSGAREAAAVAGIAAAIRGGETALRERPLVTVGVAVTSPLGRAHMVSGPGVLDSALLTSPEQLVIDHELARFIRRIRRPITVDEQSLAVDATLAILRGDRTFLDDDLTLERLRSGELTEPTLGQWLPLAEWERRGRPDLVDLAHGRVEEILAAHRVPGFGAGLEPRIEEILAEAFR